MDRSFEARDLIEVMDEAKRYNAFLIDLVSSELRGCRRVADFGAGDGRIAAAIKLRGFDVQAIEPDPVLRETIQARGLRVISDLSAEIREKVDGVYSLNVLEHIDNDRAALRQLREILRPEGRLVIYVPAFQVLFSANDKRVGHVRRYRRKGLRTIVQAAGFTIKRAEYVDSLGFLAALIYRVLGSAAGDLNPAAVRAYDRVVFPISRVLDKVLHNIFGKNLLLVATRPNETTR